MTKRTYKGVIGLALVILSLALIVFAYLPSLFVRGQEGTPMVFIKADCPVGHKLQVAYSVGDYRIWKSSAPVFMGISPIRPCKSITVSATEDTAKVHMATVGFGSETVPVTGIVSGKDDKDFIAIPPDDKRDWIAVIEGAHFGVRRGFSQVGFRGMLIFTAVGEYKIKVEGRESYEVVGGDKDIEVTVKDSRSDIERDHHIALLARFHEIDAFREVFAIFVSALLGIGVSFIAEFLLTDARRTKAKTP